MASVTTAELVAALRADTEDAERIGQLRETSVAIVNDVAPNAPEAVSNEAIIRLCGYLYDAPHFAARPMYAFRNSGAEALLSRFVARKALVV